MRILGAGLAALILLVPAGAQAHEADAFVHHLYAAYHGKGPDYLGRQAPSVFAPSLLRLIRRDAAETPKGYVGALDGDPICDCQDSDGLALKDLKVTAATKDRATAAVSLVFAGGETVHLKLDLVRVTGGWRIGDIHSSDTPSLAAFLRRHSGGR